MNVFLPFVAPASQTPANLLPEGQEIHPGFQAFPVGSHERPLQLNRGEGSGGLPSGDKFRISLSIGLDIRKVHNLAEGPVNFPVEVRTGNGVPLGTLDIRYAYPFIPYLLDLDRSQAEAAWNHGLVLTSRPEQENMVWFMTGVVSGAEALLPALYPVVETDRYQRFLDKMFSMASLQPFGWFEGCVMDALKAYANLGEERARTTLQAHWDFYLPGGELRYLSPRSMPVHQVIQNVELALPLATLDLFPNAGLEQILVEFAREQDRMEEQAGDQRHYTSEPCYTLAYPVALLARFRGLPELEGIATRLLRRRLKLLWEGDRFTQNRGETGERLFVNWGRGLAWLMLGTVKTASLLDHQEHVAGFRQQFVEIVEWAVRYRNSGELWNCFLDDPDSGQEVSGSAGIAAAMVLAVQQGWLGKDYLKLCRKVHQQIRDHYLNEEGWMHGTAQSNRDGDRLQRGGYRVISQMGMGLFASLDAALRSAGE